MNLRIRLNWFWLILAGMLLGGCRPRVEPPAVTPAMYYWKGYFQWDAYARQAQQEMGFRRLYLRLGEVALPQQVPQLSAWGRVDWSAVPTHLEVVPTIFILPNVFGQWTPAGNAALAQRLVAAVQQSLAQRPWPSLQIDCDWTARTQAGYFDFLRALRQQLPPGTQLSATIRLHQVKYRQETGIPPCDRGMLMLYNLEPPQLYRTTNSIYRHEEARRYLRGQKTYPLPLDLALPLFSWGVVFRQQQFQGFLRNLHPTKIKQLSFLAPGPSANIYRVRFDTVYQDLYLRPGDQIRLETVSFQQLQAAKALAQNVLTPHDTMALAFFQLDSIILDLYTHEALKTLYYQ